MSKQNTETGASHLSESELQTFDREINSEKNKFFDKDFKSDLRMSHYSRNIHTFLHS